MKNQVLRSAMFVAVALVAGSCGSDGSDSPRDARVLLEFSFEGTAVAQAVDGLTMKQIPDKGIEFVGGPRGKAIRFDGSGAQLRVEGVGSLAIQDAFTLEFWLKPEGHNPQRRSATYTCAAHSSTFSVSYDAFDNRLWARLQVSGKKMRLRGQKGVVQKDIWQHVALTFDTGQIALYLDGEVTARDSTSGTMDLKPKLDFVVGTWYKTNQAFYGAIDELRLLDRALSEDEIRARM